MKLLNFKYPRIKHVNSFKILLPKFILICLITLPGIVKSQTLEPITSADSLKRLTIEELMNIEVTSVSKEPEKLAEVASAIQVITQQDIQRSAASNVAEALRLSSNLQVTQLNSRHWIISSRGFNSTFSNKLLVMIDGRTVYSPLFAGVFWDAQNVMLEDIDRIEVISGPGGTLWGANAVNGVINIITKRAKETQGWFVSGGLGSTLQHEAEARYGGNIGSNIFYRVYADHTERNHTILPGGKDNTDKWGFTQGGFSMDWDVSDVNVLTVQGDFYGGKERSNPKPSSIDGQNIMGKWTHTYSESSKLILQSYFDRTWRIDVPGTINDELYTHDIDLQHNFPIGKNHNILWGAGYRFMSDKTQHATQFVGFLPEDRKMNLFSSFVQDEISLLPGRLQLTIGTKLQHNNFSRFEWQPSARISFTPFKQQVIWAAVSRAVRAPSRIDVDYFLPTYPVPSTSPSVAGGPNFVSEKLIAYELGYRIQPSSTLSFSVAGFYNRYNDLYSVEALPGTLTYQIQNGAEGTSHGIEFSGNYFLLRSWRFRGGYTYFHKKLKNKPGNVTDRSALTNLGTDADHQILLQSVLDLPANFQLDMIARYVDALPATQFTQRVPSYFTLDTRINWQFKKHLQFTLNGQNLLEKQHIEVGNGTFIQRGVYGKITWRY
jgi:iron complex outermembrane receptor protein